MATTHVSEAEAACNFAGLMDRVRAGEEVVIGSETGPVAVLHAPVPRLRSLSESLALAESYEKSHGASMRMGAEFADDLEEIVKARKPRDMSAWD